MAIRRDDFPLPDLSDPLTAPYFTAAAAGELRVPRCSRCERFVWYPSATCPRCGATEMPWTRVSGRATLFSWAVVRRAFLPAFADRVPFVSGLVEIVEDPTVRLVGFVVDVEPELLVPDEPVEAVFRPLSFPTVPGRSVPVPMFRPVGAATSSP
ncbi:MAG TPA: OB-fold domain-containing protein [Acidimicrobiia bacterium]|nr:OB-fold domain-containing protein [Acidimicrobiia bacterium]